MTGLNMTHETYDLGLLTVDVTLDWLGEDVDSIDTLINETGERRRFYSEDALDAYIEDLRDNQDLILETYNKGVS